MADSSKYKALPVSDEDCNFANISPPPTFQYKIRRAAGLVVIGIAALLVAGAIGFTLGRHRQQEMPELAWFSPPDEVRITYHYQRQFAARPDNLTQDPWKTVIPLANGFIKHPSVSPEPHGVAVFHQLHCLNNIRRAYWAAVDGVPAAHNSRPAHVRHCIDYLRQSIMCHADTNLEPIIEDLGGATGFGSEHKCRNFDKIKEWVGLWTWIAPEP